MVQCTYCVFSQLPGHKYVGLISYMFTDAVFSFLGTVSKLFVGLENQLLMILLQILG